MQFLKEKVVGVYELSKNMVRKRKEGEKRGESLIEDLLSDLDEKSYSETLVGLSRLSLEFHQYTEIFNFLLTKLEQFSYKGKYIRQTLKLLNIICFLIKCGSEQFGRDFKKNEDILTSLEEINTHFFQNSFKRQTKHLTYNLDIIRHRVTYAKRLINHPEFLEQEKSRQKTQDFIMEQNLKTQNGNQTINGLKINTSFDKESTKKYGIELSPIKPTLQKQNRKKQESEFNLSPSKSSMKPGSALGNKISNVLVS